MLKPLLRVRRNLSDKYYRTNTVLLEVMPVIRIKLMMNVELMNVFGGFYLRLGMEVVCVNQFKLVSVSDIHTNIVSGNLSIQ